MKGLASTSPGFATIEISGRSARKHYGINTGIQYLESAHGDARKIYDACAGYYRTYEMGWFIKKVPFGNSDINLDYLDQADTEQKGDLVKENKPVRLTYHQTRLVSRGHFKKFSTIIYCSSDPQNTGAPKYVEDGKPGIPSHVSFTYDA